MSILYFIILIGVLVFVHEFGHFIIARLFDVKVERFSIGFGPTLATFQGKETEWVLCALPLGGYVQMIGPDLESLELLPEEDRPRALAAKPIWQRSLVVLAGPVANLLLPILIYFGFGLLETEAPHAIIGQINYDTPAYEAGLLPGDRIVEIDGRPITYWYDLTWTISPRHGNQLNIVYERDGERLSTQIVPERISSTDPLSISREERGRIGINLMAAGTIVAPTSLDSPAVRDGLQFFDKIVAIDGNKVERFDEIESKIRTGQGQPVTLEVLRKIEVPVSFAGLYRHRRLTLQVTPDLINGEYSLGLAPAQSFLAQVDPDGPAARVGLQAGDQILSIDGRRYNNYFLITERIENEVNALLAERDAAKEDYPIAPVFEITVQRNGETLSVDYTPKVVTFQDETDHTHYRVDFGWDVFRNTVTPELQPHPLSDRIGYAANHAIDKTMEFTQMMVVGIWRLAQGRISLKSVGGPIMIGELAAEAGRAGIKPFLQIMALISINLAIVNLLPIPVLDGGRLLFYFLEALKRGPLSLRTRQIAAYVGLVCIILLMILAFKNDIERNWYRVVEYFEER